MKPTMRGFVNGLAALLTATVIAIAADVFRRFGVSLYAEQYLAGLLALALPLVFLNFSASGGRARREGPVPWYDLLAAALGFVCSLYLLVRFPDLSQQIATQPWIGLIVAGILILLFLEGLRRTTGLVLTVVTAAFFILALIGGLLPGDLVAKSIPFPRLTYYVVWDSSALFGLPLKIISTVVVIYTFFGAALFKSGGSTFFTDFAMALMGRYRGGPAKIAILGSSLFGTISGSTVSNVLTVGVVTIPLMKRAGYRPHLAAAIEACASTGGQLMPPVMGIAAFVMAEFLQVPYADVAVAAVIPALLYYLALFIQVDLEAGRSNIAPMDPAELPKLSRVLKTGWKFPIPFVVLIYALFWRGMDAGLAGLLATATVLVIAVIFPFNGKRVGLGDIIEMLRDTGLTVVGLFMIGAGAGIIIGTLNYSGVGFSLTLSLVELGGGTLIGLLVLSAIVSIILGMGMPTVGVYILLATLVAPALVQMHIAPMAAHMFIMYFGCLSMITPPVAIGAFAAANLAGSDPMRTGYASMVFGWPAFVIPFLFVFSDALLMDGPLYAILINTATAIAAVWLISAAIMGYSFRALRPGDRAVYLIAGACLMLPINIFTGARWVNIAGALLTVLLLFWERMQKRASSSAPATAAANE